MPMRTTPKLTRGVTHQMGWRDLMVADGLAVQCPPVIELHPTKDRVMLLCMRSGRRIRKGWNPNDMGSAGHAANSITGTDAKRQQCFGLAVEHRYAHC